MSFELKHLPHRTQKPRTNGVTFALDKGLSVRETEDFCEVNANYVDVVKLGWGTGYITPNLEAKLSVYRNAGIPVYFGGTLFEAYFVRNQLSDYLRFLDHYKIDTLEVSNGTIHLPDDRKQEIIRTLSNDYTVYSEVGSKDPENVLSPLKWVQLIREELNAGSAKVICEARESGTVGVFRANGEVQTELINSITGNIPLENLIFEAPQKAQQVWFIKNYGSNVNLGNINPHEIISLETLRVGLRGDTFLDMLGLAIQYQETPK